MLPDSWKERRDVRLAAGAQGLVLGDRVVGSSWRECDRLGGEGRRSRDAGRRHRAPFGVRDLLPYARLALFTLNRHLEPGSRHDAPVVFEGETARARSPPAVLPPD